MKKSEQVCVKLDYEHAKALKKEAAERKASPPELLRASHAIMPCLLAELNYYRSLVGSTWVEQAFDHVIQRAILDTETEIFASAVG